MRSYVEADNCTIWIPGLKTEAPAYHTTLRGGQCEIIGGYFRDHFPVPDVPCFVVQDASLTASYFVDNKPIGGTGYEIGSRSRQAMEIRDGDSLELTIDHQPDVDLPVTLYRACDADAAVPAVRTSSPVRAPACSELRLQRRFDNALVLQLGKRAISGATVEVFDVRGRLVMRRILTGATSLVLDRKAAGLSMIRVTGGGKTRVLKAL